MSLQPSTSQTFGPYFHIALRPLAIQRPAGATPIVISGRITDGDGRPVGDASIETWQADLAGRYPERSAQGGRPQQADLTGLGRVHSDADGGYRIETYRPGRVAAPGGGLQAPHILVAIGLRGLLKHLVTRIYFSDREGHDEDPVLTLVPATRRHTLIAQPVGPEWRWDVVLQGSGETVFLDC